MKTARTRKRVLETMRCFAATLDVLMVSFDMLGAVHEVVLDRVQEVANCAIGVPILLIFPTENVANGLFMNKTRHVKKDLTKPLNPDALVLAISRL